MNETTKVICTTVSGIVTALVLGEVFGNAISRPIAAWRQRKNQVNVTNLASLIDVMNQRICDLEEKINKEEA
jgi:hypothetical protein